MCGRISVKTRDARVILAATARGDGARAGQTYLVRWEGKLKGDETSAEMSLTLKNHELIHFELFGNRLRGKS